MAKLPTKPLKVTAHLSDYGFCSDDGIIMFDSILYSAWFKANPAMDDQIRKIGLPLKQIQDQGFRWAASKGIYNILKTAPTYKKITDLMGSTLWVTTNKTIEFYCVGAKDKIERLLNEELFIGKANTLNQGVVKSWLVEKAEDDYSLIHPKFGLMRPLPVLEAIDYKDKLDLSRYQKRMYDIRPPYWKTENQRMCYVPVP